MAAPTTPSRFDDAPADEAATDHAVARGFPRDQADGRHYVGGRALRALVWMATGSPGQAACLADAAGRLVVVLFFTLGIWQVASGNLLVGVWLSFVGCILLR